MLLLPCFDNSMEKVVGVDGAQVFILPYPLCGHKRYVAVNDVARPSEGITAWVVSSGVHTLYKPMNAVSYDEQVEKEGD